MKGIRFWMFLEDIPYLLDTVSVAAEEKGFNSRNDSVEELLVVLYTSIYYYYTFCV